MRLPSEERRRERLSPAFASRPSVWAEMCQPSVEANDADTRSRAEHERVLMQSRLAMLRRRVPKPDILGKLMHTLIAWGVLDAAASGWGTGFGLGKRLAMRAAQHNDTPTSTAHPSMFEVSSRGAWLPTCSDRECPGCAPLRVRRVPLAGAERSEALEPEETTDGPQRRGA
jgi:hypothetical protein